MPAKVVNEIKVMLEQEVKRIFKAKAIKWDPRIDRVR